MRVVQEIKFKNDVNGNPRHLLVIFETKENQVLSSSVIKLGYQDASSFINKDDMRLIPIYNYLPYSKTIEQFNCK